MSDYVTKRMLDREAEFTEQKTISVFVGTWNVNGKFASDALDTWLMCEAEPDIYAIGFQELDLSAEAFILNDNTREEDWTRAVARGLGDRATNYWKIVSKQLVGLLLMVFVRKEHVTIVKDVQTDSAGVGIMGMMGNKGGVSVRMRFHDSTICFVNCHLAADDTQVLRRNQDYLEICRRITFPINPSYSVPSSPVSPITPIPTSPISATAASPNWLQNNIPIAVNIGGMIGISGGPAPEKALTIFDSDRLIWMGDLNYRIEALPLAEIKDLWEKRDFDVLLKFDQLSIQRTNKWAFDEFEEGQITFPPTYKYDVRTNNWDSSEKKRAPAWTDRILWRSKDSDGIKQLAYRSHIDITQSDHKPVSAIFTMKIKKILPYKQNEVYISIVRELDKFENDNLPDANVSCSVFDYGEIKYLGAPQTKSVTIENTGHVILKFKFVPKFDEQHICQPWLTIEPSQGFIVPGEGETIKLTVAVDNVSAPALNAGEKIEDILIIHLENGKDFFISIHGKYVPTCFANNLERLVRLPKPIKLAHDENLSLLPIGHQISVPKEIWRILNFISQYGKNVNDLFTVTGDQSLITYIRECLDTGEEFDLSLLLDDPQKKQESLPTPLEDDDKTIVELDKHSTDLSTLTEKPSHGSLGDNIGVHSMAEVLIRFLQSLPEPVIPFHLYDQCINIKSRLAAHEVLELIPSVHANVFIYITSLLQEVINHNKKDIGRIETLAFVLGSVMLRSKTNDRLRMELHASQAQKKKEFLLYFITNELELEDDEVEDNFSADL
ncbi:7372_t:CDS:10 [Ambispora gerdemannii]|uniref:7372_t:CDS:1 n=1 Tax=Ambispora gerdemannii TaxID=144530 RepID=A0A9N8YQP2_9GLOM|nr:7372_t:CDS:10 [Ambispora gerdemannii]